MRDQRAPADSAARLLDPEGMARLSVTLAIALECLTGPALADDDLPGTNGFITYGTGELTGRVTSPDGKKALRTTDVHIALDHNGELIVKTDNDGRFRATLRGHQTAVVYVRAKARIVAQISVPSPGAPGGELIEMHETLPPAVMPQPFSKRTEVPPYSSQAIQKNVWVRGHVLLAIDTMGRVTRIKLLDAPGYDLDAIAIDRAFKLGFVPAKDRNGNSVAALVVWTFEWPSYWWIRGRKYLPAEIASVPCKGSGPSTTLYRDCSLPSIGKAVNLPWIEPPATP